MRPTVQGIYIIYLLQGAKTAVDWATIDEDNTKRTKLQKLSNR